MARVLAFSVQIEKTVGIRGAPDPQLAMLTSLSIEDLIPTDHPLRKIRVVVDAVLADLDDSFDAMHAAGGRRSVPPEPLLKATVLMAMHSIRSRLLVKPNVPPFVQSHVAMKNAFVHFAGVGGSPSRELCCSARA